jgi:hypothetical protein
MATFAFPPGVTYVDLEYDDRFLRNPLDLETWEKMCALLAAGILASAVLNRAGDVSKKHTKAWRTKRNVAFCACNR